MRITARSAGMSEDEDDEVLEAGFAEGADGAGTSILFQRDLFADDPWQGDTNDPELFNNTYCVATGSGKTCFGGVTSVHLEGLRVRFTLNRDTAETLDLDEVIDVDFLAPEGAVQDFKNGIKRVLSWGNPREVPNIREW